MKSFIGKKNIYVELFRTGELKGVDKRAICLCSEMNDKLDTL